MRTVQQALPGWGRLPGPASRLVTPQDEGDLDQALRAGPLVVRGLGRSYGDACCAPLLVDGRALRGAFELDQSQGLLRVGAGRSLGEITALSLPWGWAPAVLPGTRHVTVGGAVSADVHGKNHHQDGAFCRHVVSLRVRVADGSCLDCSRELEAGLFRAVCGGMGLCGAVVEATLQLVPRQSSGFMRQTVPCRNLDEALSLLRESRASHSVAWVDAATPGRALGRSLVHLGEPDKEPGPLTPSADASLGLPFPLPLNLVRPPMMRAFNQVVWLAGTRLGSRSGRQSYGDFFWPLDSVNQWNHIYGHSGFLQFQCLLPEQLVEREAARPLDELLRHFLKVGGSGLAVMKTMGARDESTAPIAFPGAGVTLALDLPAAQATRQAVRQAYELVAQWGGRIYLAKDALLNAATFARMTPELEVWRALRQRWDPHGLWQSDLSKRLEL